jgi:hypothetical protein
MQPRGHQSLWRSPKPSTVALRLAACVALLLAGCGGAAANVRAMRAYEREEVTPELHQ